MYLGRIIPAKPRLMALVMAALILGGVCPLGQSQTPQLIKDLNTGFLTSGGNGSPAFFVTVNNRLFYMAETPSNGFEPWVTDGTIAGTHLVSDILPGSASSYPLYMAPFGTQVVFQAFWSGFGMEIWTMNEFVAGPIGDINTSGDAARFELNPSFTEMDGYIYFVAATNPSGPELWRSDGLFFSAQMVKEINTDSTVGAFNNSNRVQMAVSGSELYFIATNGMSGPELWKTSGTEAGTVKIVNLATPLPADSVMGDSKWLVELNGEVLFSAGSNGMPSLFKTNGTAGNSTLLLEGSVDRFVRYGDEVYFSATVNGEAGTWKTDGTALGTAPVLDSEGNPLPKPTVMTVSDGILYVATHRPGVAAELWRTDGTQDGTTLVKTLSTGATAAEVGAMTDAGTRIFLGQKTLTSSTEGPLWVSDGTEEGTSQVGNLYYDYQNGFLSAIGTLNGNAYFRGWDPDNQIQLWKSDGTPEGTGLFYITSVTPRSGAPSHYFPGGPLAYFYANDGIHDVEVWSSDGTEAGTAMMTDGPVAQSVANGAGHVNGITLFSGKDSTNGVELWKSNGLPSGTGLLKDIFPGTGGGASTPPFPLSSNPGLFRNGTHKVYFTATTSVGTRIWVTDGTADGTVQIPNGAYQTALPGRSVVLDDVLYYHGSFGGQTGLWKSDGTEAGTQLVLALTGSLFDFIISGGRVYFVEYATGPFPRNYKLYVTDGTPGGTQILKTMPEVDNFLGYLGGADIGGTLIFSFLAMDGGLFKTDGTLAGTVSVAPVFARNLSGDRGRAYFRAFNEFGAEIWTTDGTAAGTYMIKDNIPGSNYDTIGGPLVTFNGICYFNLDLPGTGWEPYRTDGTVAGTTIVGDLNPGAGSSFPALPVPVRNQLFYSATRDDIGREPWVLTVPELGGPIVWADFDHVGTRLGTDPLPVIYLQEALDLVDLQGTVKIKTGQTNERIRITQPVRIEAIGGAARLGVN